MAVINFDIDNDRGINLGLLHGRQKWFRPKVDQILKLVHGEVLSEVERRCGNLGNQACQPLVEVVRGKGDSLEAVTLKCDPSKCPYYPSAGQDAIA